MKKEKNISTTTLKDNINTGEKKNIVSFIKSNGIKKSINPITFVEEKQKNEELYNKLVHKEE